MDSVVNYNFSATLAQHNLPALARTQLTELQINLGYLCNQACIHCHVEAGPKRSEIMSWSVMEKILFWIDQNKILRVDLTGGAPELNPNFRQLVDQLLIRNIATTVRCNLTVLAEPKQRDLAQWYGKRDIRIVCSLPCYTHKNVDYQRGKGVFNKSIDALKALNHHGYGYEENKILDLVYNPIEPKLPPSQATLQQDYHQQLKQDFGIRFNQLLTLTNLPIKRFASFLQRTGQHRRYLQLLVDNFNPDTVCTLMCRHLLSVNWQGNIYDCDFNQILNISCAATKQRKLWQITAQQLLGAPIALDSHCFGCTAGAGSSCSGALIN